MTIKREISGILNKLIKNHNVLIIIGPKGSGKTKLAIELFKSFDYFTFNRKSSEGILSKNITSRKISNNRNLILDEVPADYNIEVTIKKLLDENKLIKKIVIICSSKNEKLSSLVKTFPDKVSQVKLLPLSHGEINGNFKKELSLDIVTFYGGISGAYENSEYFGEYFSNYISEIFKQDVFGKIRAKYNDKIILLLKYLAQNVGNVLNFNPLALSLNTNYRKFIPMLSVLIDCGIVFLLPSYEKVFGRRVIMFPRVYFYDTALAAYFNGINSSYQFSSDKMRDNLVNNFMILEIMKAFYNKGLNPYFYYWKEVLRTDIDCVIEMKGEILPVVIKEVTFPYNKIISESRTFSKLSGIPPEKSCILYRGKKSHIFRGYNLLSYKDIDKLPEYFSQ